MSVAWPIELPNLLAGLDVQPNKLIKQSTMQTGPAKLALEDNVEFDIVTGSLILTRAQIVIFEEFLRDDIDYGATSFLVVHPITLVETLFHLLDRGSYQQVAPDGFQFSITLQEVPS